MFHKEVGQFVLATFEADVHTVFGDDLKGRLACHILYK